MRPDWPIVMDRAEPPIEIPGARIIPFTRPTPRPAPQIAPGLLHRVVARIGRAVIDGFAHCARGMHPELFCREDEPPRPDPDALADDAPRSWRSDIDVELHRIMSLHRFRG
ncbi:hypothetical protein [Inquilinus limosus]|uniref:Uncharacterized protein n=1 Tax=Inquilinus limosus MP06 TaxID=1398085 RepID=A0A0A0D095_9PROT|nr:hypothetical protein [Inquilinus limosus]KGM31258.1 hypothetical protein P409_28250 [Inquilinus limosus MP06]